MPLVYCNFQCNALQADLEAHKKQARSDHEELLRTISLLEAMNTELGQHNFLWRSVQHALHTPNPEGPFPEFDTTPIPDIADFVDKGILTNVFQLRGALRELEESSKAKYVIHNKWIQGSNFFFNSVPQW